MNFDKCFVTSSFPHSVSALSQQCTLEESVNLAAYSSVWHRSLNSTLRHLLYRRLHRCRRYFQTLYHSLRQCSWWHFSHSELLDGQLWRTSLCWMDHPLSKTDYVRYIDQVRGGSFGICWRRQDCWVRCKCFGWKKSWTKCWKCKFGSDLRIRWMSVLHIALSSTVMISRLTDR